MSVTPPPDPAPAQRLCDMLAAQATRRPRAVALRFEGRTLDYAALLARVQRMAGLLRQRPVRAGDRVAWLGLNHMDQLVALFALARLGAMLVPLNFRLAAPEWDAVLRDCTPCLLLHDAHWAEAASALAQRQGVTAQPIDDWAGVLDAASAAHAASDAADDAAHHAGEADAGNGAAAALLVYTSGTTGQPKGAVHTQANLLANMAAARAVQQLSPADRVLTVLPLFHVGGLCIQTLPALSAGAEVLLSARFDPAATLACIARDRPTLTLQVPATMKALIEHPDWPATDLRCLRAVWAGSSTLPPALVQAFHARGVPVCNVYGATETGPFSIALDERHAFSHAGACGWPAPGVEVRLDAPRDGVGELLLRGPAIVRHYWPQRPALDADGWFHSGDLARQAADGAYTVVGRAKDMIISGGENIYPAEIENLLATHPAVAECCVLGLPDAQWGEVVVAAIVPRAGRAADAQALQAHLAPQLARYKLPRRYLSVDALPRTALGKVQKALLARQLTASGQGPDPARDADRD